MTSAMCLCLSLTHSMSSSFSRASFSEPSLDLYLDEEEMQEDSSGAYFNGVARGRGFSGF